MSFTIENGVLENYRPENGETAVTIPAGVTGIGRYAFYERKHITSVTIPEGVTGIGRYAFYERKHITSVTIPGSVKKIGGETWDGAFYGCTSLTSVTIPGSVKKIGGETWDGAFYGCTNLTSVTIEEGVAGIGEGAFCGCTSLTSVTLPGSVTKIGEKAFPGSGSVSVTLLSGKRHAGGTAQIVNGKVQSAENLCQILFGGMKLAAGSLAHLYDRVALNRDLETVVSLYMTQSGVAVKRSCEEILYADGTAAVSAMAAVLPANGAGQSHYKKAAEFALSCGKDLRPEALTALYEAAVAAKAKSAVALLQKPAEEAAHGWKPTMEGATGHPIEAFCLEHCSEAVLDRALRECKIEPGQLPRVPYSGGETPAPPFVVKCAIVPYMMAEERRFLPEADQVAATLDTGALQQALEELYKANFQAITDHAYARPLMIPYCRFASSRQMKDLLAGMRKWNEWGRYGPNGRKACQYTENALCLSETREALLWADKKGRLKEFAALRDTTEDILRDTVLMDFGLDAEGGKSYDLGSTVIRATLERDLTISLCDTRSGKTVRSLPKRGADPEKHAACTEDLADLRRNLKQAVKQRNKLLFAMFLNGSTLSAADWQAGYLANPVLRMVAQLVVWDQGTSTFILSPEGAPINCHGAPYALREEVPVGVAHPMEIPPQEVAAWQEYFLARKLRQPFEQVWEPVRDPKTIRPDRYKGCQLLIQGTRGQEKHGIFLEDWDVRQEFELRLTDCYLENEETTPRWDHTIVATDTFTLGKFSFEKYTRYTNHIVYLLDRWTLSQRIAKDDITVMDLIGGFTLAQIMSFIALASEKQAVNCTAALLEYKNAHFAMQDAMDEFTLEDWV